MTDPFHFNPIGVVRCEDKRENLGPITFEEKQKRKATIEVFPEFAEGLTDIEGFSNIHVIWVFHRSREAHLISHPPWDHRPHGVFATRSPNRPNPIGLTIVNLEEREGNLLHISGADMIDGTPVLDIKPYTKSNAYTGISEGWLEDVRDGIN